MAKRQLRSDTAAEAASNPERQPPRKKKKAEPVRHLCNICDTMRIDTAFPDYNPSSDCEHLIHTCKTCLKKWVQAQIEANHFATGKNDGKTFGVRCPECVAVMRSVNIEIAATKKVYQRFEELERRHIAEHTPGWRWCLAPNCKAGQVHESEDVVETIKKEEIVEAKPKSVMTNAKLKKKKHTPDEVVEEPEPAADICTCNECGAKACVNCDRIWHEGESCKEYQLRVKDRFDEEDKSLLEMAKVTRKCPSCTKKIIKNGGCPSMYCSQCNTPFCWTCMTVLENGHFCKCYPRPPPAQPQNRVLPPPPNRDGRRIGVDEPLPPTQIQGSGSRLLVLD